jgi:ABC-type transporter Mla MlaB component
MNTQSSAAHSQKVAAALHVTGTTWAIEGPVTFDSVAKLEDTLDRTRSTPETVSLRGASEVDSSAVALLVAIKRRHPNTHFIDVPTPLTQLADLYGVRDLIL